MAAKALDILSADRDGFFVLIEEEAIDEMAHENNAPLMIKSGAALDATVKVAVDFARRHPGTLIVVQGDHETGGLTIENPDDEAGEEREDGPFPVKGTIAAGLRRLDDQRPHRRGHADHGQRPGLGAVRRRDRQHRRPRHHRPRDALTAPDRDVLAAVAGEGRPSPVAPALRRPHPGQARHQVQLRGPDVAERHREALPAEFDVVRDHALVGDVVLVEADLVL